MPTYEHSIDVNVPVRVAYNQWTQFEDFPQFMEGVEEIKQINDTKLHWRAEIANVTEEWDAEITEQIPGRAHRVDQHDRRDQRGCRHVPSPGRQHNPRHVADRI